MYSSCTQCQDIVTDWGSKSWCRRPGVLALMTHYKVVMSAHDLKSVPVLV